MSLLFRCGDPGLPRCGVLGLCRPSPATVAVDFASGCLVLHRVVRLFGCLVVVTSLRRSGALSVCRLPLAAVAMEFASGFLVLLSCRSCIRFASLSCRVIRSFVALLRRSGTLSVCRLPLVAVAVEFALDFLVLLSCRSFIQFVSLSCRVIRSFCRRCFVAALRRSICVNVS